MKKTVLLVTVVFLTFALSVNTNAFEMDEVQIHGFISQGYMHSDENNFLTDTEDGSFQFNEMGINFTARVTDNLRLGIQFFSRDLGILGNNEITLDWAYGDYLFYDWLGLRVGRLRKPYGLFNETRDYDMLRTSILLPQGVYGEDQRDFFSTLDGAGIYGDIPLSIFGSLYYYFMAGTFHIDQDSGMTKTVETSMIFEVEEWHFEDEFYDVQLQWSTPLKGLLLSGTFIRYFDLSFEGAMVTGPKIIFEMPVTEMKVASLEYTIGELIFAVEYSLISVESKLTSEVGDMPNPFANRESEGYYASVSYRFADWFQLGTYYSVFYFDKGDREGDFFVRSNRPTYYAWAKDFAVSLRFDINSNWIVKLEGHSTDGTSMVYTIDNPEGVERYWYLGAAKVTFRF